MKLFLPIVVFLCLCMSVSGRSFHQPCNFADTSLPTQRGILTSKSNEETTENLSFSSKPEVHSISQDSMNSFNVLKISNPQILCQEVGKNSWHLILSWPRMEGVTSPFTFKVEVRNNYVNTGAWDSLGLVTNVTSAEITNLDLRMEYQFRVTPVIARSSSLLPMITNWTNLSAELPIIRSSSHTEVPKSINFTLPRRSRISLGGVIVLAIISSCCQACCLACYFKETFQVKVLSDGVVLPTKSKELKEKIIAEKKIIAIV